jgi:hypothetical protein
MICGTFHPFILKDERKSSKISVRIAVTSSTQSGSGIHSTVTLVSLHKE